MLRDREEVRFGMEEVTSNGPSAGRGSSGRPPSDPRSTGQRCLRTLGMLCTDEHRRAVMFHDQEGGHVW